MDGRLDRAKIKYGGKFLDSDVDDVKVLVSLFPTLLFLIIYCSCYYQVRFIKFPYDLLPKSSFCLRIEFAGCLDLNLVCPKFKRFCQQIPGKMSSN